MWSLPHVWPASAVLLSRRMEFVLRAVGSGRTRTILLGIWLAGAGATSVWRPAHLSNQTIFAYDYLTSSVVKGLYAEYRHTGFRNHYQYYSKTSSYLLAEQTCKQNMKGDRRKL